MLFIRTEIDYSAFTSFLHLASLLCGNGLVFPKMIDIASDSDILIVNNKDYFFKYLQGVFFNDLDAFCEIEHSGQKQLRKRVFSSTKKWHRLKLLFDPSQCIKILTR